MGQLYPWIFHVPKVLLGEGVPLVVFALGLMTI